jgi:NitT/TauT family transport system ATP-binding protein
MSSRPGKIVTEKNVEFDFPRSLSDTYKPEFVSLVEELRNHISLERQ